MRVKKVILPGRSRLLSWMLIVILLLTACESSAGNTSRSTPTGSQVGAAPLPTQSSTAQTTHPAAGNPSPADLPTTPVPNKPAAALSAAVNPATKTGVPAFDHIVVILFENHGYNEVIGNQNLPNFNRLATDNVLLTNYHSVTHPSLPNYLALIGGSTFGITTDCGGCFVNATSLPDLIESSGRTWKTYQEDLPSPCFHGGTSSYDLNHDPFMYFDPIRNSASRCQQSVVPLTQLDDDLRANTLPNYSFIMPNICDSGHNCSLTVSDGWINNVVNKLQSSPTLGQKSMIFIVFDESSADNSSCCGLPAKAGGRVAAILISPLAKTGTQDNPPLSHYSLLKTILLSWNLPMLGATGNPETQPITMPWK